MSGSSVVWLEDFQVFFSASNVVNAELLDKEVN
jgi:hypothetical protein